MSVNLNQVAINSHCSLPDIEQFSTKTIEDYSIVSRKHLERILHNSERSLVNITLFLRNKLKRKLSNTYSIRIFEK